MHIVTAAAFQMPDTKNAPPLYVGAVCEEGAVWGINAPARTLALAAPALDNTLLADALLGADVRIYEGTGKRGGTFAVFGGDAPAAGSYDGTTLGRGDLDYLLFDDDPSLVEVFRGGFERAWEAAPALARPSETSPGYVASAKAPRFHKAGGPFISLCLRNLSFGSPLMTTR